ncbi:MAG TPA: winged helix-turn-helix domain-containing protein [Pyrinomonadaceae bacterium]|nr:winged helix-turn-helix domain-containing protein [Pyrinomonadaceae bacterium]
MNRQALHFYEFGVFRVDAQERLLYREGEVVPLTPKVFDTLLVLVQNSGHVLEKTELMQTLWPDSFVEESSLAQNISLLRKALGEGASERQYIETVPRRGYRFVAEVRETKREAAEATTTDETALTVAAPHADDVSHAPVARRRVRQVYVLMAAVLLCSAVAGFFYARAHKNRRAKTETAAKSIAVLPFKTLGTEDETELLGLGMADALIIKLGKLPRPSVLPTGSIIKYTKRDADALAIGRELGVDAVLDGTVQRAGERVRVTAQLVRLSDGKTLWSGKFDQQYSGIFAIQDSLSEQLAAALVSELTNNDRQRLAGGRLTQNTEAYQAYLMGLYFWNRRTEENLAKAIGYLQQAVEKDADFALAHAVLADCYYLCQTSGYKIVPRGEALRRADESARRALVLDDTIAEAHTAMAGVKMAYREFEEAGREFRRAIELNPNYAVARVRYGYFLFGSLRLEEAVAEMKRAQELDPASPVTNAALAFMLRMARDDDGAIKHNRRALELQPDTIGAHAGIAESYIRKGMFDEAHAEIEKVRQTEPLMAVQLRAYAFAAAGRRTEALAILSELQQSDASVPPINYALIYGHLGDKEKAFEWLNKDSFSPAARALLHFDPDLDPLRDDPRYEEILRREDIARASK